MCSAWSDLSIIPSKSQEVISVLPAESMENFLPNLGNTFDVYS